MHPWIWTLGRSIPVLPYAYTWWSWWIWQAGGTAPPPPPQWPAVPASHETDHIFLTLSTCSQSKPQNNHKIFSVRLLHIFQRISVTTIIFNKQNHADSKYSTQATVHVTFSVAEPVHCWHARAESIFYHRLQYTLKFFCKNYHVGSDVVLSSTASSTCHRLLGHRPENCTDQLVHNLKLVQCELETKKIILPQKTWWQ